MKELSVGIIFDNNAETGFDDTESEFDNAVLFTDNFAIAFNAFFVFFTLDFLDPNELLLPLKTVISSGILFDTSFASVLADIHFPTDDSFVDIITTLSYPS